MNYLVMHTYGIPPDLSYSVIFLARVLAWMPCINLKIPWNLFLESFLCSIPFLSLTRSLPLSALYPSRHSLSLSISLFLVSNLSPSLWYLRDDKKCTSYTLSTGDRLHSFSCGLLLKQSQGGARTTSSLHNERVINIIVRTSVITFMFAFTTISGIKIQIDHLSQPDNSMFIYIFLFRYHTCKF